jgi:ubiquinone/menaquinone biosynthesis C-methylase UbiE
MSKEQQIGAKPVGWVGILAGRLMNLIRKNEYREIIQGLKSRSLEPVQCILDIGCGGGDAIQMLSRQFPDSLIYGIDHAQEMVNLSEKVNRAAIYAGKVKILHNPVDAMDITSHSVDIVTAFDTINFWDDYAKAYKEIRRVLKEDGSLIVVNGYPPVGSTWYEFVKFKNDAAYKDFLFEHGFQVTHLEIKNHTIVMDTLIQLPQ